jgi:stage V sporulation protein B
MLIGSAALVMLAVVQVQTSILQGSGKLYTVTLILIAGIIGKIITNYILIAIPSVNIVGAIIGSVTGYLISITLNNLVIRRMLHIRFSFPGLLAKPLFSAAVMGIFIFFEYRVLDYLLAPLGLYFSNAVAALGSVFTGAIIYFITMLMVGGIKGEDLEILPARTRSLIPSALMKKLRL